MRKAKIISGLLTILSVFIFSLAIMIQRNEALNKKFDTVISYDEIDIKNMAVSPNTMVKQMSNSTPISTFSEVEMETVPASIIIPPRIEVYEGMTMEELAAKLDRNLGNGYIAGKGYLIASKCIEKGVDPYIAVAIMLHETGCKSNCSKLVRYCNNVGGQKGSPGCNGGQYKAFATLDEGIIGFIDNLYRNYYARGLTTIDMIAPRYAESSAWTAKIHSYVNSIRAN